jgi:DNA-binding LacI/PurR family transcriptional regulator
MTKISQAAVARTAHVDQKTVSRVFLDPDTVAPETRERVLAVARSLGYSPVSRRATALDGQVVVLLNDPDPNRTTLNSDALRSASIVLTAHRVALVVASFPDVAYLDARELITILRAFGAAAIIANYHGELPMGLDEHLDHCGLPLVWLNRRRDLSSVYFDEVANGRQVTRALLAAGHRRIAYFEIDWWTDSGVAPHYSVVERRSGYRLEMREADLAADYRSIAPALLHDPGDLRTWLHQHLIDDRNAPTAMTGYAGEIPLIQHHLGATGVVFPERLSIAMHETRPDAGMRAISGSILDWSALGKAAADMVLHRMTNPKTALPSVVLRPGWLPGATIAAPTA